MHRLGGQRARLDGLRMAAHDLAHARAVQVRRTVERAAQKGDHIVADYVGKLDGEPFEGGSARDQLIELGSGSLIPGFEEQLTGVTAGEARTIAVTFPAD